VDIKPVFHLDGGGTATVSRPSRHDSIVVEVIQTWAPMVEELFKGLNYPICPDQPHGVQGRTSRLPIRWGPDSSRCFDTRFNYPVRGCMEQLTKWCQTGLYAAVAKAFLLRSLGASGN
jgi:hypothetical protein